MTFDYINTQSKDSKQWELDGSILHKFIHAFGNILNTVFQSLCQVVGYKHVCETFPAFDWFREKTGTNLI